MSTHECDQEERIERIQLTADGTVKQLACIQVELMEIKTLLKERILKYDSHIEQGVTFRSNMANTTLGLIIAVLISCVGGLVAYGQICQKVDVSYAHTQESIYGHAKP